MTPTNLTADLPAPRDDEPSSLRQDIADELADHLACAVRREQLVGWAVPTNERGNDPERWAQPTLQRVLAKFGDPRAVARRLWWDHMRERMMAQRFTAIMAGIGAAACIAACVLLWQFVQDSRDGQAASLAEMRDFNAKLLTGLQRPADAPAANSGWAMVRIKLLDAETGEPVNDSTVVLQGRASNGGVDNSISLEKQPVNGLVDFGGMPNGQYHLRVQCPSHKVRLEEQLLIGPGQPDEVVLRVPQNSGLSVARVDLAAPAPINEQLRFVLKLRFDNLKVDGRAWRPEADFNSLVIDSTGRVMGQIDRDEGRTEHSGYDVPLYRIGDASPIPATSVSLDRIEVLDPIDADIAGALWRGRRAAQSTFVGHELLLLQPSCPVEVEQSADGACVLRPALTSSFWSALSRAEVLAGLRAPPEGMQIAEFSSIQPASNVRVGDPLMIALRLPSSGERAQDGYEALPVVQTVEFAGFGADLVARWHNGTPAAWNCKVLVSTEQAALLELAKRVPSSGLMIFGIHSPLVTPDSIGSNEEVRERLQQAIDAGEPPVNEGSETSNSQS